MIPIDKNCDYDTELRIEVRSTATTVCVAVSLQAEFPEFATAGAAGVLARRLMLKNSANLSRIPCPEMKPRPPGKPGGASSAGEVVPINHISNPNALMT